MRALNRTDPTPVTVHNLTQGSGATGTYFNVLSVHIPHPASAGTRLAWINPETGTVLATVFYYFNTAGSGTVDVGVASDGTAAGSSFIDGGTMTVQVHYPGTVMGTAAASATAGGEDLMYQLVGPGGTGTNNSITMTINEAATSTAVGGLIVQYFPIGR